MKTLIILLTLSVLTVGAYANGCHEEKPAQEPQHEEPAKVYTCPMHPEVTQNEPGDCPKCGMHLEEVVPAETPKE